LDYILSLRDVQLCESSLPIRMRPSLYVVNVSLGG